MGRAASTLPAQAFACASEPPPHTNGISPLQQQAAHGPSSLQQQVANGPNPLQQVANGPSPLQQQQAANGRERPVRCPKVLPIGTSPPMRAWCLAVLWTSFILPPLLWAHVLLAYPFPSLLQLVLGPVLTMSLIGAGMSACLHRFFSHQAFQTTRAFQFVLGIVSCLAYQNGPLWWAGKHNRHHRFCEKPEDPHSMSQSHSVWYSSTYWTISPVEYHYDLDYIPARFRNCPELWVLDRLCLVPPILVWLAVWRLFGYQHMVLCAIVPMMCCRHLTLLFNIYFHPPKGGWKAFSLYGAAAVPAANAAGTHDVRCRATDDTVSLHGAPGALANLVGEAHHLDHHHFPRKYHRPGWDLPFHLFVRPLMAAGLIWEN